MKCLESNLYHDRDNAISCTGSFVLIYYSVFVLEIF